MTKLEIYVREFTGIVSAIRRGEKGIVKGDFLFVSREILSVMLSKNDYDTVENKLKFWRDVHWIFAEDEHLTCKIVVEKQRVRMFKISLSAYQALLQHSHRAKNRKETDR
jgi:hypothetical protein